MRETMKQLGTEETINTDLQGSSPNTGTRVDSLLADTVYFIDAFIAMDLKPLQFSSWDIGSL